MEKQFLVISAFCFVRLRAENWAKSSDVDIIGAGHLEVNGFLLENVDLISTLIPTQNKTSPLSYHSYHNCAVKFFSKEKRFPFVFDAWHGLPLKIDVGASSVHFCALY